MKDYVVQETLSVIYEKREKEKYQCLYNIDTAKLAECLNNIVDFWEDDTRQYITAEEVKETIAKTIRDYEERN